MRPEKILEEINADPNPNVLLHFTRGELLALVIHICDEIETQVEKNAGSMIRTLETIRGKL
jgi:hypothetical protein